MNFNKEIKFKYRKKAIFKKAEGESVNRSFVKWQREAHDGSIYAESDGKGAVFRYLYLDNSQLLLERLTIMLI